MAAKTIAQEIEQQIADGANLKQGNSFGVQVRNMDAGDPLEVGDVITIDKDYKVLEAKINDESEDKYPFVIAHVQNETTGVERNMRFYPNMLAKTTFPIENGKRLPKVKTTGTAAKKYSEFETADEAFKAMSNNGTQDIKIRVVSDNQVTFYDRFTEKERQTHIYGYDLV